MAEALQQTSPATAEHFDILIVGAGISGIGGACHLQEKRPGTSFVLLESQQEFGGTWRTHTFPGIRSDSDLFTFGYKFKPWLGAPIATAPEILKYLGETIEEHDLKKHIRYGHQVKTAEWSDDERLWTITVERLETGEILTFTGNFLWMCQGYFKHAHGYVPEWPGMDNFKGPILHPQEWPDDLDYEGKNIVVIGSGATAATIVPAMAKTAGHVTVLQRSPTFYLPVPSQNELAELLRPLNLPDEMFHDIMRRKMLLDSQMINERSFSEPEALRQELLGMARMFLGPDQDIEKHFSPKYRPWQQRLALIPDGDFFTSIRTGKASVVTDEIEEFTQDGIRTKSGEELKADIIVSATGFNLCVLGDIDFTINGEPLDFSDTCTYRGIMYTGIPNMAWVFGYLRSSWTLRSDLISEFVCRLLDHMDELGADKVVAQLRPEDGNMEQVSFIEPENFNAGYITRNIHLLPKQGTYEPWEFPQDYYVERDQIPGADLDDGTLVYTPRADQQQRSIVAD